MKIDPIRTTDQNAIMWAMLTDISQQIPWVVNGCKCMMSKEDWKDVLTANWKREQRIAQGIDGGIVMLGQRTSKMSKAQMSELIELMYAFGAERGVIWSHPEAQDRAHA